MKLNTRNIVISCSTLFLLFMTTLLSSFVVNRWRETGYYSIETCTNPTIFSIKKQQLYYKGVVDAYYFSNKTYLLEPVKLYYPAMYTIFSMSSKSEVKNKITEIYAENKQNDTFRCLIDLDKNIGIFERYPYALGWIILLFCCVLSIVYILMYMFKKHRDIFYQTDLDIFIEETEIPPKYTQDDPDLPEYEKGVYDRTPPSDNLSLVSYTITNSDSDSDV